MMNIQDIQLLTTQIKKDNLLCKTHDELRLYCKCNKNFLSSFMALRKKLKISNNHSWQSAIRLIYAAYETFDFNIHLFISENLIDKEGEVSPSRLNLFININPKIADKIMNITSDFPKEFTLVGRLEFIRKGITKFPLCNNCKIQHVSWKNAGSKLLNYCSKKCADSSQLTKENRKKTNKERYGHEYFIASDIGKNKKIESTKKRFGIECVLSLPEIRKKADETKKERYGDKNYNNKAAAQTTMYTKFGKNNYVETDEFQNKSKNTKKNKYGNENFNNREKSSQTIFKKFGVKNYVETDEFKQKSEKTLLKNYGVRKPSQSKEILNRSKKSLFNVYQYKNTNLTYQASYEKFFLELMDERGLLNEVSIPEPINYQFEDKKCVYHPDFMFRGQIIEIKSTWSYDNNGRDKKRGLKNEAKWAATRLLYPLRITMSKAAIRSLVNSFEILNSITIK